MQKHFVAWLAGAALTLAVRLPAFAFGTIPTPAPTSYPDVVVPTHISQYIKLNTCWHVGAMDALNNLCSRSGGGAGQPTPGPGGVAGDLGDLHSDGVDAVEGNAPGGMNFFAGAGIVGVYYMDEFIIHGCLTNAPGIYNNVKPNGSIPAPSNITPNNYPNILGLKSTYYGGVIDMPNNNAQPGLCGTNSYGSLMGDLTPASIAWWKNYAEQTAVYYPVNNLASYGGGTPGARTGVQVLRHDDADYPGHRFQNQLLCFGLPQSQGTSAQNYTSCLSAGQANGANNNNVSRAENRYFTLHTGFYDQDSQWVANVQALFRMSADMNVKAMYNDYTNPAGYVYFNQPDRANVWAAMCEGCINGFNHQGWINHINAELVANEWGVIFHAFNPPSTSHATSTFLYASLWLGMLDPKLVMVTGDGGGDTINSGVAITPLEWIVPTQPIADPNALRFDPAQVNYNFTAVPTTYGIETLKASGGGYVREFAKCFRGDSGSATSIGPCAAVVFEDAGTFPTLQGTYAHTASWTGGGVLKQSEFNTGDTGTLSVTGSAPPTAGTAESAGTAFILTQ